MTAATLLTFAILGIAILLFVTEWVRVDLVGLMVLLALALTGLVSTEQALAGFSNSAVVTVWAMFILSAGLARTGVSSMIGRQLLRWAGQGEGRLIALLMSVTALLSAFMNNTGVAAMFLPITLEISKRSKQPASLLLLPMAYGCLLGGLILLIGTASNLLVRDALREAGYAPLGMFDFTAGGLLILAVSVGYMALFGRRWLPRTAARGPLAAANGENGQHTTYGVYGLEQRLAYLVLPPTSPLAGKTLAESRLAAALGLNVLRLRRATGEKISCEANTVLEGGDKLLILGRLERIEAIAAHPILTVVQDQSPLAQLQAAEMALGEWTLPATSPLVGHTLAELNLRREKGVNVLAIGQKGVWRRSGLRHVVLQAGDTLLVQGGAGRMAGLAEQEGYRPWQGTDSAVHPIEQQLLFIHIPTESALVGYSLAQSQLGAIYGLVALGVRRGQAAWQLAEPDLTMQADDLLMLWGRPQEIEALKGLDSLQVERRVDVSLENLDDGTNQLVEVMLSPHTSLNGKTLTELKFREKYGVSVLAIWRGDHAQRSRLGDVPLKFGDALLCYGALDRLALIAQDRDFVVLKEELNEPPHTAKAPLAVAIMLGVVGAIIGLGWPVAIAAITGCVLMALTGCLTMEEAYKSVSWRSVFLIAAMLPLGTALEQSGGAAFLATAVIQSVGQYGPYVVLAGLMVLCMMITQFMPSAVVAVIMSPITLTTAATMGISPYPLMLGIAYALAASFLSPVAHPANVLVMSPGGYRFGDYVRHGLPIAVIVVLVSVPLLPWLFPF